MSHPFLRYLSGCLNTKIISCKEKVRTLIALGSYYIVWCGKRDFESDIRYAKSIEFAYANLARNLPCGETGSAKSVPQPTKQKEVDLMVNLFCWCGKRDLNPYIKDTRPSNVRVCRFRHSRKCFTIILDNIAFVKCFFDKIL